MDYKKKYIKYKTKYLNLSQNGGVKCSSCDVKQVKTLNGVCYFSFFKNIYGRKILLLGNSHNNANLCDPKIRDIKNVYDVHTWLFDLAGITSNKLDIMLEVPFIDEIMQQQLDDDEYYHASQRNMPKTAPFADLKPGNRYDPVTMTNFAFYNYYTYDKKHIIDRNSNLRYHYCDIRDDVFESPLRIFMNPTIFNTDKPTEPLYIHILQQLNTYFVTEMSKLTHDEIFGIMRYVIKNDATFKETYDVLLLKFVKYQLQYAPKPLLFSMYHTEVDERRLIEDDTHILHRYWRIFEKRIRKLDQSLPKYFVIDGKNMDMMDALINVYMTLQLPPILEKIKWYFLVSYPTDVYTLLRLFTQFTSGESKEIINNAVLFGGAYHSIIYTSFIKAISREEPLISIDNIQLNNECTELQVPFNFTL